MIDEGHSTAAALGVGVRACVCMYMGLRVCMYAHVYVHRLGWCWTRDSLGSMALMLWFHWEGVRLPG